MRKDTNQRAGKKPGGKAAAGVEKPRRGRPKHKTQISVRIDQNVLAQTYEFIGRTGYRITDMLERGLVMVMKAEGETPAISSDVRFLIGRATAERQHLMQHLLALLALPECRGLSRFEQATLTYLVEYLRLLPMDDCYEAALGTYGARPRELGRPKRPALGA
jgi:hypothetical protein